MELLLGFGVGGSSSGSLEGLRASALKFLEKGDLPTAVTTLTQDARGWN